VRRWSRLVGRGPSIDQRSRQTRHVGTRRGSGRGSSVCSCGCPDLPWRTAASNVAASSVLCLSAGGAYIPWLGRDGSEGPLTITGGPNLDCTPRPSLTFVIGAIHAIHSTIEERGFAPGSSATKGPTTMATTNGTIKRITDKGFGFIAASDGTEYFFHQS